MDLSITKKQKQFIDAKEDEVLFGGAAGGGKSYGQLVDALLYALQYKGSRQLILRRTFPDLERSLILVSLELFPREIYKYNSSTHRGVFANGSLMEFGYCDNERDVYRYQGAEYDVIRFDELTHFTESMYLYLASRLRGTKPYPRQIKSSTNPGGVGHNWVKERFIDPCPPNTTIHTKEGTRVFIPSLITDNKYLMQSDPGYIERLKRLSEKDQKALLYGDWNIFDGQYFTEFDRDLHVVEPFVIPSHWRRYRTLDYGLDMLACYWIAVDEEGKAFVYKELYKPNLIISEAAKAINALTDEEIYATLAPPDLYNRRQDSGKSAADIFAENGVVLTKAQNDRVMGWLDLKEWLHPRKDMFGGKDASLKIFANCVNLIRTLPALQYDEKNPNDVANEPHELTHAPDAIRYFVAGRPLCTDKPLEPDEDAPPEYETQVDDFLNFGG